MTKLLLESRCRSVLRAEMERCGRLRRGRSRSGFTIIEVVLVLAIVGLIFLMMFVALPALQKASRDKLRKQDVGVVAAAVQQFMKNNSGKEPVATSKSNVNLDPNDPRNDVDGDGTPDRWVSSSHSMQLDKYLTGLSEDWVTTTVGVVDGVCYMRAGTASRPCSTPDWAPTSGGPGYIRFIIGESDILGHIDVVTHARCPDEGDSINQTTGAEYMDVPVQDASPKDMAVFRYLESGVFYCEDVY